jgi:hypothetical protein
MKMSSKLYDTLKWVCIIVLPAAAYGYGELAAIWTLPLGEQIPKTINLIATIMGIILGVSNANFKKENDIIVQEKIEG